jgi:uncharacterized membrane protein YeaQ/YmgE (transglycosylase-associated protein family)
MMSLLTWLMLGLVAGWLTGRFLNGGSPEPVFDIVMGIAGSLLAGFIMRVTPSPAQNGIFYSTLVAITGAVVLTGLTGYATGRRRRAYISQP